MKKWFYFACKQTAAVKLALYVSHSYISSSRLIGESFISATDNINKTPNKCMESIVNNGNATNIIFGASELKPILENQLPWEKNELWGIFIMLELKNGKLIHFLYGIGKKNCHFKFQQNRQSDCIWAWLR